MILNKLHELSRFSPLQPAVVAGGKSISYFELERQSSRMATYLIQAGVAPDSLVAIYTSRDVNAIVALFAVIKAGAAYTFVEDDGVRAENYHRIAAIGADAILCDSEHGDALREMGLPALDVRAALLAEDLGRINIYDGNATAYVLFTSGSTGQPKGVSVSWDNVSHYTQSVKERFGIDGSLNYAHVSTLAADLGNTSLFLSLATGGCLHLLSVQDRKDPLAFRDYLATHAIDFLKITPSHWNAMFPSALAADVEFPQLKYLVFGGEAFPKALAHRILASGRIKRLYNHYGPTETTVGVTVFPVSSIELIDSLAAESIPIGRALGRTLLRVRKEDGTFSSKAAKGELYIGGPSVAKGYRGNPQETARCFVTLEGEDRDQRFYKTGDLVTLDDSGLVQFLGRVDRQVKVNGYRVELEHVESVLRAVPLIEDAAVFFLELHGRERLIAAVITQQAEHPGDWLKDQLQDLMPGYMIPNTVVPMPDFPRNPNGKTSLGILREQIITMLEGQFGGEGQNTWDIDAADERLKILGNIFCKHLPSATIDVDDSFFDRGGDSLDAIQLIAELQEKGYPVSAHAFLKDPSLRGLMQVLDRQDKASPKPKTRNLARLNLFSPAQREFLEQGLTQVDHYNQAILLKSGKKVDLAILNSALTKLLENHPVLTTAYGSDELGLFASHTEKDGNDALSVSFHPGTSEAEIQSHIERVAERTHRSLSLAEGIVFRAHLFRVKSGDDYILLVAHHLAVDVISWRIIIAELTRIYSDLYFGSPTPNPAPRTSFWDWIEHVEANQGLLQSDWLQQTQERAAAHTRYFDASNTEGEASTLWLGFSTEETQHFQRDLVSSSGQPFHIILLAAFGLCLARLRHGKPVLVDMESHGRVTFDDSTDVSRVVGWHTSTFPLQFDLTSLDMPNALAEVSRVHGEVRDLGVGFGLHRTMPAGPYGPSAPVCFNYLGVVNFSHDERFQLVPTQFSFGRARHEQNNRCHELKLTARIIDGQLLIDLSFPKSVEAASMHEVLSGIHQELFALASLPSSAPQIVLEPGTRTGAMNYAPRQLIAQTRQQKHRVYNHVLLTGATGYIGIYALKELIFQSNAHIHCLVRNKNGASARARLEQIFDWYFPGIRLEGFKDRYTVHEGDIGDEMLGLEPELYLQLGRKLDAIYHFAADTRLFGTELEFARSNIQSVKSCIELAGFQRAKDLHYISTLAISGVNPKDEVLLFSEESQDVGQEFQNNYELTKFTAEGLVNAFRMQGHNAFIYRLGNVSGESQTARFQINAKDNRLVQFLASCVKVGRLPVSLGEPVILSPVDEVASGLVAISLDACSDPGTYHVDSSHEVGMERIFAALKRSGFRFESEDHRSFADMFHAIDAVDDPDILLGKFWAHRKSRNIKYCNDRTLRTLERLGRGFSPLSDEWLDKFVAALVNENVFPIPMGNYRKMAAARHMQMHV